MLVNIKRLADILYNLDCCGSGQTDDALGLDLFDEAGDWKPIYVRHNRLFIITMVISIRMVRTF